MERIADVSQRRAVPSDGVTSSVDEHGRVSLRKPKFGRFGSRILRMARMPTDFTVHLDPLGSAVWGLMAGRTVAEVRVALEARFPTEGDIGARLGKFIGAMVSRGLVRLE